MLNLFYFFYVRIERETALLECYDGYIMFVDNSIWKKFIEIIFSTVDWSVLNINKNKVPKFIDY
jgi:hypothetical protein